MFLSENLQEKWEPILEHGDLPKIEDNYKKAVTAVILENQEKALTEEASILVEDEKTNQVILTYRRDEILDLVSSVSNYIQKK